MRTFTSILLSMVLVGCAAERLHRDGLALIKEGRYEQGLSELAKAEADAPDTVLYHKDYLRSREQIVNQLLLQAAGEQAAEHYQQASEVYGRVLKIEPGNRRASTGLLEVDREKRHAEVLGNAQKEFNAGKPEGAKALLNAVLLETPQHPRALTLLRQINEQAQQESLNAAVLLPKFKKPVTLQFRDANLKMVFEALSKASGINVLLDKDIKNDVKATVFVKDVSVENAIDLILFQNQLEKKVLGENTVFVYPNTPAKVKDYQDLKIRRFHLTNADPKQVQALLKTMLKAKDTFVDEASNSVVMRDTPDAIKLAEKLVAGQDVPEPEVMMEVEVLEVSSSKLMQLGIQLPDTLTLGVPAGTLAALLRANRNSITATAASTTLNAHLDDGETNVLASPRIRARNREKAKILIGDRVPVITNSVTPVATGTPVVTGNVQYLDVGLKLDVEPDVHLDGDVAIKVSLEVSTIIKEITNVAAGQTGGTLAYQIGTRNASTVLRLKDGETQVLAGLINNEDRQTANKFPGLGQIPVLGRLFSTHKDDSKKTEIVLAITPHIIRNHQNSDADKMEFWSGTESSLKNAQLMLKSGTISTNPSAPSAGVKALPQAAVAPVSGVAKGNVQSVLAMGWEGATRAKVGDTFSLTLKASSEQKIANLEVLLGFDPTLVRVLDTQEGTFFRASNAPSNVSSKAGERAGQVILNVSSGADAVAGEGSLATVLFEVLSAVKPQLDISTSRATANNGAGEPVVVLPPAAYSLILEP